MSEVLLRCYKCDKASLSEVERYINNRFSIYSPDSSCMFMDKVFADEFSKTVEYAKTFGTQFVLDGLLGSKSVKLSDPECIEFYIYKSFAGSIPVIYTKSVTDFEKLICELIYKGIYSEHIKNTGASFIYGKSKSFVILSNKPYSNVNARELGLDDAVWEEYSVIIRREHECLHFFTRRCYGGTRNHLHDELIADFVGIIRASGTYKADWFLKFLGIEENGKSAKKNVKKRFDIYTEGVSSAATEVLKQIVKAAAYSLERYYNAHKDEDLLEIIDFLCIHNLAELSYFEQIPAY